jgi:hypothetical protein
MEQAPSRLSLLISASHGYEKAISAAVTFVAGIKSSNCCGPNHAIGASRVGRQRLFTGRLIWVSRNTSAYHRP